MKRADYCRIHTELVNNGKVTFSKREELIDFFADMLAEIYLNYATSLYVTAVEFQSRKNADPEIVRMATQKYLNNKMPGEPKGIIESILAHIIKTPDIRVDMGNNFDLYTKIVKAVGRGDLPTRIFEQRIIYNIKVKALTIERLTF